MAEKFIPESDGEFYTMANGFAASIAADPERYNIHPDDVEYLTRIVKRFSDALLKSAPAGTKNTVACVAKNDARKEAEQLIRMHANIIRADPNISTGEKISLHIRERAGKPKRRKCPMSAPYLRLRSAPAEGEPGQGCHKIEFRDGPPLGNDSRLAVEPQSGRRAKPPGAVRIELYFDLIDPDDEPPQHPMEASSGWPCHLRSFTRSPMVVKFPVPARPMRVVYWARWADSTGEQGPWSKTLVAGIEGGRAMRPALEDQREQRRSIYIQIARVERDRFLTHSNGNDHAMLPAPEEFVQEPKEVGDAAA